VFANYIESSNIFKSTAGSSSSLSDGNFAQPQLELFTFAFGGNYNFQAHGTCCSMYSTVTKTLNITNVSLITGSLRGTKTMPANHLTVGQKYRMKATGTYTAAGTLPNTTLKMRLGGLDLATTGTFQFTASTTGVWEYACEVTVESLSGTSCVVRAHPAMWFQASTATARVDRYSSLNTTVTVNPQNSLVWDLVATIANVAGLTLNTHSFILEQVQ
jgi:hypothetical protein